MHLARAAACTGFFDVSVQEYCHACSVKALFDAEMTLHQHFLAHCFRDDNAVDFEYHSISVYQFVAVVPVVQDGFRAFLALAWHALVISCAVPHFCQFRVGSVAIM